MKKITDLTVERFRTTHNKDRFGNRIRGQEIYSAKRKVKTVGGTQRFAHFFLDFLAIQLVAIPIQFSLSIMEHQTNSFNMINILILNASPIFSLLLFPGYYILTESLWGKSLGKFATQTQVIDEYGNKPTLSNLIGRNFLRLVPFEALSCIGDNSRGWHDKWSDTYVVTDKEYNIIQRLLNEQGQDELTDHLI